MPSSFIKELFDAAEMGSLPDEDVVPYRQSMQQLRDDERDRKLLQEEFRAKGFLQGYEESFAEGQRIGYLTVAKRLLAMGLDILTISKATGLSEEQIAGLQPS